MENHSHHHNQQDSFSGKIFFNKYKVQTKLGEGSFGKIYSAINIQTNERYALKMVKNKLINYKIRNHEIQVKNY